MEVSGPAVGAAEGATSPRKGASKAWGVWGVGRQGVGRGLEGGWQGVGRGVGIQLEGQNEGSAGGWKAHVAAHWSRTR